MTDIVAFLTARLDEDEELAQAAEADWTPTNPDLPRGTHLVYGLEHVGYGLNYQTFACAWEPGRVLADVAAKRAILADYQVVVANNAIAKSTGGDELTTAARDLIIKTLRMVLLRLAAADAHHPDYDESWRP